MVETQQECRAFFLEGAERAGRFWLGYVARHGTAHPSVAAERDNVLQAIGACRRCAWQTAAELAIRFRGVMIRAGLWRMWEQVVTELLEYKKADCSLATEAGLQSLLGETLRRQGRAAEWVALAEGLLERLRRQGASWQWAHCLRELGSHYCDLGCWDEAEALGREMLPFVTAEYEDGMLADAYILLGRACRARHEWEEAIAHFGSGLQYADMPRQMSIHNFVALVYLDVGRPRDALGHLEMALETAEAIHERPGQAVILSNLGRAYFAIDRLDLALKYNEAGLVISREMENRRHEMRILSQLGDVYSALEQDERAVGYYEQALALARDLKAGEWGARIEAALAGAQK